jgi:hypothetical protein
VSIPEKSEKLIISEYGDEYKTMCRSKAYNPKSDKMINTDYRYEISCDRLQTVKADIFDNVWIINLKRRDDRWEYTQEELSKINIKPHRWEATNAISKDFKEFYEELPDPKRKKGEVACFLSHYKLLKHLQKIGVEYGIIMEDDIKIFSNVSKDLMLRELNQSKGFEILFLGYCKWKPYDKLLEGDGNVGADILTTVKGAQCGHAYAVSKYGIDKLVRAIEDEFIQKNMYDAAIDQFYEKWCEDKLCYLSYDMISDDPVKTFGNGIVFQDRNITTNIPVKAPIKKTTPNKKEIRK